MPAPTTLIRPLAESRPPAQTWSALPAPRPSNDQPTLDLESEDLGDDHDLGDGLGSGDRGLGGRLPPRPVANGVQVTVVRSRWCARPDRSLPDARSWGVSLAQALVETLHALRPAAQLNRWVAEDVLAALTLHQRRRRVARATASRSGSHPSTRTAAPPVLRSIRLQHPCSDVAEVSAHVVVSGHSTAMAFRLEACGTRWLCTALELGPRPG